MEHADAVALLQLEHLREVAEALLRMSRENAWGHVTVRFQGGSIRQVEHLITVRVDGAEASAVRPAA